MTIPSPQKFLRPPSVLASSLETRQQKGCRQSSDPFAATERCGWQVKSSIALYKSSQTQAENRRPTEHNAVVEPLIDIGVRYHQPRCVLQRGGLSCTLQAATSWLVDSQPWNASPSSSGGRRPHLPAQAGGGNPSAL